MNADNEVTSHRDEILSRSETQTGLVYFGSCKRALNGTTFQSGLRFQIGLSSLRVSCKRAPAQQGTVLEVHSFFYKSNFIRTRASYLTKS